MQLRYRGQDYTVQCDQSLSLTYSPRAKFSNLESPLPASMEIPAAVVLRYRGAAYLQF